MNAPATKADQKRSQTLLVRSPTLLDSPRVHRSRKCRSNLRGCLGMGSAVSTTDHEYIKHSHQDHRSRQEQEQIARLELQVGDLEREVQKQKELRVMYRKRLERTQDYLKYCLQIAQQNGFLQLVMNPKDTQECLLSPANNMNTNLMMINGNSSPQFPTPIQQRHQSDLVHIEEQAKVNGWLIDDPSEIEIKDKIAQGSTADIHLATWRGLEVAVKCISPEFFHSNPAGMSFFAQELDTLSRQRHPFVLQMMGAFIQPPDHAWVVTELLSTTLKDWLHGPRNGRQARDEAIPLPPLTERLARAVEISQAMQYLHEQKPSLIHRDLKPSNIFLDDTLHVRVADFGHARFLGDQEFALSGEIGTYVYMAPEVIRSEPYDKKCDVYSFGIILNELITGDHPFIERSDYGLPKIAMEVAEGKLRLALPDDNDGQFGELIDLIRHTWDQDPSFRPPFSAITLHLRSFQRRVFTREEI